MVPKRMHARAHNPAMTNATHAVARLRLLLSGLLLIRP